MSSHSLAYTPIFELFTQNLGDIYTVFSVCDNQLAEVHLKVRLLPLKSQNKQLLQLQNDFLADLYF